MMKKLLIAGLTTGALALGIGATTAPANAQIYFGIGGGPGWGYHHYRPGWGYGGYRPGWGYYRPGPRCGWVVKWRNGHKIKRWRCW